MENLTYNQYNVNHSEECDFGRGGCRYWTDGCTHPRGPKVYGSGVCWNYCPRISLDISKGLHENANGHSADKTKGV